MSAARTKGTATGTSGSESDRQFGAPCDVIPSGRMRRLSDEVSGDLLRQRTDRRPRSPSRCQTPSAGRLGRARCEPRVGQWPIDGERRCVVGSWLLGALDTAVRGRHGSRHRPQSRCQSTEADRHLCGPPSHCLVGSSWRDSLPWRVITRWQRLTESSRVPTPPGRRRSGGPQK